MKIQKKFASLVLGATLLHAKQPITIQPDQDTLQQLYAHHLASATPIKLHLGCGQSHLDGYINIDFPPSEHTIQQTTGADVFANITTLKFPAQSIYEVRSHHVFEHFERPIALALLCAWHAWLEVGGILIIETPDFHKSIRMLLDAQYSYVQKQCVMRHVFGSHEASWAIHCDGWYREKFEHILHKLGFEIISAQESQWLLTANITIHAKKVHHCEQEELHQKALELLAEHLVDMSNSEMLMLKTWFDKFATAHKQMQAL